jgi:hypothetical protein
LIEMVKAFAALTSLCPDFLVRDGRPQMEDPFVDLYMLDGVAVRADGRFTETLLATRNIPSRQEQMLALIIAYVWSHARIWSE